MNHDIFLMNYGVNVSENNMMIESIAEGRDVEPHLQETRAAYAAKSMSDPDLTDFSQKAINAAKIFGESNQKNNDGTTTILIEGLRVTIHAMGIHRAVSVELIDDNEVSREKYNAALLAAKTYQETRYNLANNNCVTAVSTVLNAIHPGFVRENNSDPWEQDRDVQRFCKANCREENGEFKAIKDECTLVKTFRTRYTITMQNELGKRFRRSNLTDKLNKNFASITDIIRHAYTKKTGHSRTTRTEKVLTSRLRWAKRNKEGVLIATAEAPNEFKKGLAAFNNDLQKIDAIKKIYASVGGKTITSPFWNTNLQLVKTIHELNKAAAKYPKGSSTKTLKIMQKEILTLADRGDWKKLHSELLAEAERPQPFLLKILSDEQFWETLKKAIKDPEVPKELIRGLLKQVSLVAPVGDMQYPVNTEALKQIMLLAKDSEHFDLIAEQVAAQKAAIEQLESPQLLINEGEFSDLMATYETCNKCLEINTYANSGEWLKVLEELKVLESTAADNATRPFSEKSFWKILDQALQDSSAPNELIENLLGRITFWQPAPGYPASQKNLLHLMDLAQQSGRYRLIEKQLEQIDNSPPLENSKQILSEDESQKLKEKHDNHVTKNKEQAKAKDEMKSKPNMPAPTTALPQATGRRSRAARTATCKNPLNKA